MVAAGQPGSPGDAIEVMTALLRVSAIAGVLSLGGCASWTPNWNFMPNLGGTTNVSLTIESDPPGADAKTSLGPSCRTPCMLPVPADRSFTVNYSLNGYLPQVVTVGPRSIGNVQVDLAGNPGLGDDFSQPELTPNPVYAQLQPAPPPAPTRRGSRPKQPKQPPLR
jgi:hypothetical protein